MLRVAVLLALHASCPALIHAQTPSSVAEVARREAFLKTSPGAAIYADEAERGGRVSRVYGAAFSHGVNPVDSAERFLAEHADLFSSDFAQLMPVGPNGDGAHVITLGYNPDDDSYRFSLVGYTQHVNGIPVFRGDVRLLVRNEPGYPLVLASNGLRDVRAFAAGFAGKPIPPSKIDVNRISRRALNQFGPGATVGEQEQVIWAGYDGAPAAEPRLAFKFVVTGTGVFDRNLKQRMLYVVDAATNQILFQEDQILHADITTTVRGNATQGTAADACNPEAPTPLPYARITVGASTYFADANGMVTIPNPGTASLTVTSTIGGRWFTVNDAQNGSVSSVSQTSSGGSVSLLHNAANSAADQRAEVNAYLHANIARDYLLSFNPSFPTIATQFNFPINVMVSGTCNAFYDGSSINFYPAGGGCNNTAFSTIVHHEYGHHIVDRAGSGQGAYGEGFSDAVAVLITDESRLAIGFQSCSSGLRDANNDCQYSATACSSCGSSVHSCGRLFSGCVWSLRDRLLQSRPSDYRQVLSQLVLDSVLLHTGTSITPAIAIDFLALDDNDSDSTNGSPNYGAISSAFAEHGMAAPQIVTFDFPDGRPPLTGPLVGASFPVAVSFSTAAPRAGSGRLHYRVGTTGAFTSVPMTETATNQYTASLPAASCGSIISYYFSAETLTGVLNTSPAAAPNTVYTAQVATGYDATFADDCETDRGWFLGAGDDTATAGRWVRVDPVGTFGSNGVPASPEDDASPAPGTRCFTTGQGIVGGAVGAADVDGGRTTLVSGSISAPSPEARVSYYRWYSNAAGTAPNLDTFRVDISNNNGLTWVPLETVGPAGPECSGGWIYREFRIADFLTPTTTMRIRFIAEDIGDASVVEAAVDEVRFTSLTCRDPRDLNGDGVTNAADLAIFLGGWGLPGTSDLNQDGTTNALDLSILLSGWN